MCYVIYICYAYNMLKKKVSQRASFLNQNTAMKNIVSNKSIFFLSHTNFIFGVKYLLENSIMFCAILAVLNRLVYFGNWFRLLRADSPLGLRTVMLNRVFYCGLVLVCGYVRVVHNGQRWLDLNKFL